MADSSFDIVSKIDRQEVDNAMNQAEREIATALRLQEHRRHDRVVRRARDRDLRQRRRPRHRRARRVQGASWSSASSRLKVLDAGEPRQSGRESQDLGHPQGGHRSEDAKKVGKLIRDEGPKGVKAQVQGDELRVSSEEARRPAGRHRAGQGPGLRLRGAVHQLPLRHAQTLTIRIWCTARQRRLGGLSRRRTASQAR